MLKLPRHIRVALGITAGFALVVVALGLSAGAELRLPSERVSQALGFSAALPLGLGLFVYLAAQGIFIALGRKKPSKALLREAGSDMTLLVLFVIITYLHFNLKMWIPVINSALFDLEYMKSDEALRWLVDLFTWISGAIHSAFSSDVRWYHTFFLSMFILSFCELAVMRRDRYPHFVIGIMLVLALGGLSYLIAPALGPFIYETGNDALATEAQNGMLVGYRQVQDQGMPWINRWGSEYFTGALAAMPSLHVAHATVMTYYMVTSRAFLAPLCVFFWIWILIDSIALRWHYVVDAPAGVALAVFVIWLTGRLLGARSPVSAAAEPAPALASTDNPAPRS